MSEWKFIFILKFDGLLGFTLQVCHSMQLSLNIFHLIGLVSHFTLNWGRLSLFHLGDGILDFVIAAFPNILLNLFLWSRRNDKQVAMRVEVLIDWQVLHKVSDHLRLLDSAIPLFFFGKSVKGVAHNSNQHVQEHNVGEESCQYEVDPLEGAILTCLISQEIVVADP